MSSLNPHAGAAMPEGIDAILHAAGVDKATFRATIPPSADIGPAGEGGPILVSYCTDIEGNYDYWQRWLGMSKVVTRLDEEGKRMHIPHTWTGRAPHSAMSIVSNSTMNSINIAKSYGGRYPDPVYPPYAKLQLKPNCHLVFGGDVCDRGPGDIRVLWDLLQLFEDHPGRVHFILGNRDVNKLRLPVELHDVYTRQNGGTYWLPRDPEQRPQHNVDRLKWILAKTMGAPEDFEHRRTELKQMILQQKRDSAAARQAARYRGQAASSLPSDSDGIDDSFWDVNNKYATDKISVSDEDVMQSYFDLLLPTALGKSQAQTPRAALSAHGLLLKYMAYARLLLRIEDNLFVHGGLNTHNLGWVAPQSPFKRYEDEISATGAIVEAGAGAQGGDRISVVQGRLSGSAAAAAAAVAAGTGTGGVLADLSKHGESKDAAGAGAGAGAAAGVGPATAGRITRRAAFDAWLSEANWRAALEVRDFAENTRQFVLGLNSRKPNGPRNNRSTFGQNKYDANYTVTATDSGVPAHWAMTGTYTHPQPGSRLAMQGMAVLPDRSRNPSVIYSGYSYNCMPVNIDRYEGTVLDADGNIVADAMRGSDLARMVSNVATGSMMVKRRAYVAKPSASTLQEEEEGEEEGSVSSADDESTVATGETPRAPVPSKGRVHAVAAAAGSTSAFAPISPSPSPSSSPSPSPANAPSRSASPAAVAAAASAPSVAPELFMTPELARICVRDLSINRIFCGHQPHGDAPLTINVTIPDDAEHQSDIEREKDRLQIIVADTSYSANTQWNFQPELVPKAKSGDLVLWDDDWKAVQLEDLKTQNEDREKDMEEEADDEAISVLDYPEGLLTADAKEEARLKEEATKGGDGGDKKAAPAAEAKRLGIDSDSKQDAKDAKADAKTSPMGMAKPKVSTYTPTPQMLVDAEDQTQYNARPLKLWNLDAINSQVNTRGIAVSEVLVYVPHFTGVGSNESVAEAEARRQLLQQQQQRQGGSAAGKASRVFMHGVLSEGSTYAFEQPACKYKTDTSEDVHQGCNASRPPHDRYLGKSTRSGAWVVKAVNVVAKHNICTQQTRHLPGTAGDNRAQGHARTKVEGQSTLQDKVYLLSNGGAGFAFRNKFVAASDMEEEMNN